MLMSTCNRLEVYFMGRAAPERLPSDMPNPVLLTGSDCLEHLFRVAAGLESLSVGENEILGQLTQSFQNAQLLGTCYGNLSAIVMKAIAVGKKVREKTDISKGRTSIAHIATDLAFDGSKPGSRVAIVGNGTMARKIASYASEYTSDITVFARRIPTIDSSAWPKGVEFRRLGDFYSMISKFNLIFTATSAKSPIISQKDARQIIPGTILVDVSVPPNISLGGHEAENLKIITLVDVEKIVISNLDRKISSIKDAELIVQEELKAFLFKYQRLSSDQVVSELYRYAQLVRDRETQRLLDEIGSPDPKLEESIRAMSNAMANKLLHPVSMALKLIASSGKESSDVGEALAEMQNHIAKYLKKEEEECQKIIKDVKEG